MNTIYAFIDAVFVEWLSPCIHANACLLSLLHAPLATWHVVVSNTMAFFFSDASDISLTGIALGADRFPTHWVQLVTVSCARFLIIR